MRRAIVAIAAALAGVAVCRGRTITVDDDGAGDFPTIQAAIDDSNDGDTVLVADGTYTIDCNASYYDRYRGFYFHSGEDANSMVDGFTITNGYADDGGGIKCYSSSPIISNCVIMGNSVDKNGGGIYCWDSSPTLINCTFTENWTPTVYIPPRPVLSASGGAMCNYENSSPILSNCTFGNNAAISGGGIGNYLGCNPMLANCIFSNNWAHVGGGIVNYLSSPTLTNCTFSNKDATWIWGTGMYNLQSSSPKLTNCILWDGGDEIRNYHSTITITYSDVQGGYTGVYVDPNSTLNWGVGNIDADPCFADPNEGDYHLKSQGGRWDPNEGGWPTDDVMSPCVDAGDRMSPIGPEPFPNGGIINMGAYGGTTEASKSHFGVASCETIVAGDINGDCNVNFLDFRIMALHWLEGSWPGGAVTTTYVFLPDPNTLTTSGGFDGNGHGSYCIEGQFELTVDSKTLPAESLHVQVALMRCFI